MATNRFKRVSRARYTRPMPPAPIKSRIWYGPKRPPGAGSSAKGIGGRTTSGASRRRNSDSISRRTSSSSGHASHTNSLRRSICCLREAS